MTNLGPRVKKDIPMKIYDNNDTLVLDLDKVLDGWQNQFSGLYNKPEPVNESTDNINIYDILRPKKLREDEMCQPDYVQNPELNGPLSCDELEYMIKRFKKNKSLGIDQIPNEVLKKHDFMLILFQLYVKCFDSGLLPSLWLKTMIMPIPKSSTKDPFVPLHYRSISLLPCVCEVVSEIINRRISKYCELLDLFVDEQNGFRKNRSCTDHIYTFTSLIRNTCSENKSTFCCFIDIQKAFDWDLLFKLLEYNIDRKIYYCIITMYNHPLSCVKLNSNVTDWFPTESGVYIPG